MIKTEIQMTIQRSSVGQLIKQGCRYGGQKKLANIELDMVADMVADIEVDKLADMVAHMEVDKVSDMAADKQSLKCSKTKCIGPKLFDAKCTRLVCLLSFTSLFLYKFIVAECHSSKM